MTKFRILFGINLGILLLALWECFTIGTSTLTMTTPQGQSKVIPQDHWLAVSPTVTVAVIAAAVLAGAAMLHARGRTGLASAVLFVPAVLVVLGAILLAGLMIVFSINTPRY
ncbi:MAG: hypothetical protein JWR10_4571 [Rubritepida sp.]|nr:hypothetical protein [Rubritepida sp.]